MSDNCGFANREEPDEARVERKKFPDDDDASIPTLSDEEVEAQWRRFEKETRMSQKQRSAGGPGCLIAAAALGIAMAVYIHCGPPATRERIAAASALQATFRAHHVPLAVHAAGPRCDVLLINSVDSQGRIAMLLDSDVENIFYGGEHWESVPGGVYRYRRDNHFAGVLFVESGGDAWVDGTVAPGVSGRYGVSKVEEKEMWLIGKVEACR
jgi:hypothetical protein